jgi:hypothetical protein
LDCGIVVASGSMCLFFEGFELRVFAGEWFVSGLLLFCSSNQGNIQLSRTFPRNFRATTFMSGLKDIVIALKPMLHVTAYVYLKRYRMYRMEKEKETIQKAHANDNETK